jgi:hypothetical protein
VNYYGSLTEGVSTKCNAVYFDNPQFASSSVVQLGESTGIYEDANAKYVFADGALSVTANLSPKVGRIRFAGENNDSITVYGITHYTSYDVSNGKYTQSLGAVKKKITNNYTPYIYGVFTDSSQPRLNVITKVSGFTRMPSSSIMQAGQSGYMSVPTESSHNGWQNSVILKVNGVEFSMIPVEYSEGNFLLAETELTSELYVAIVGSGYSTNLQRPAYARYSTFSTFLSKLNALTELNFRFPTYNEWLFAAKGGNKSQNYTYSGSNIIANVAWYEGNSNNSYHDVKQLQPNELGFYDMSGNAAEYVLLGSTTYTSYYYNMGGSYASYDSNCKSTSYQTESYDQSNYGLRIALSNN